MKKNGCLFAFTLSYVLTTVMNVTGAETIDKGDIVFERGSESGTVSGAVLRGERDQYSLVASAGQRMEVEISSPEDNAVFQLSVYSYGTGEDVALDGAGDGDDAKYWEGRLPKPGYSKDGKQNVVNIVVGGTRGNASYELTVTLPSAAANGSQPNSANGKYQDLLQTLYCPQDKAQYGKFSDYGYWKGGSWCGQTGKDGYWVWEAPNWYVWAEQAQAPGKAMSGTITSLEEGDRGCYVEFTDDNGETQTELATFEVCEQTDVIDEKVTFSYTKQDVLAADCAGDPDCGRSDTVWMISDIE